MTEAGEGGFGAPNGLVHDLFSRPSRQRFRSGQETVEIRIGFSLATGLPTVNGPERSVSRASVAAAKRKDPAQAAMTPCWRQVLRA
jgi:hypothetical protein